MAATAFGCPRCGGRQVIMGGRAIRTFDENGGLVNDVEANRIFNIDEDDWLCANLHCGAIFVNAHWHKLAKQVPDEEVTKHILRIVACACGTITYKDLSLIYKRLTGFSVNHHLSWSSVLYELCKSDLKAGRPMLSSLVIVEHNGMPSSGFEWQALGVKFEDKNRCWKAWRGYKRKVHRYYWNEHFRPWLAKPIAHFTAKAPVQGVP